MIFPPVIIKGILLIAICVPRTILGSHSTDYPEGNDYQSKRISTTSAGGEEDDGNVQSPPFSEDVSDNPEEVISQFDSKRKSPLTKTNSSDTLIYSTRTTLRSRENDTVNSVQDVNNYNRLHLNKVTSRYNDAVSVSDSKPLESHLTTGKDKNYELKNDEVTSTPTPNRRSKAATYPFSSTIGHKNNDKSDDDDDDVYTEEPELHPSGGKSPSEFNKNTEWKINEVKKKINKKESSLDQFENNDKILVSKEKTLKDTSFKTDKIQNKEFQHNIIKSTIQPETLDEYHSTTNISVIDSDRAVKNISVNNESGSNLLEIESVSSETLNNGKVGSVSDTPHYVNSVISKHSVTVENIQTLNETPTIKYSDKQSVQNNINNTSVFSTRDNVDSSLISTVTPPSINGHLINLHESKNTIPVLKWEPTTEPTLKLITKPTKVPDNDILVLNNSTNDSSNDIKKGIHFKKPQISTSPTSIHYTNPTKDMDIKTSISSSTVPRLSIEFKNRIGTTVRAKNTPTTTPASLPTIKYSARTTLPAYENISNTELPIVSTNTDKNNSSDIIEYLSNPPSNDTLLKPITGYNSKKRPSKLSYLTTTASTVPYEDTTISYSTPSDNYSTLNPIRKATSRNETATITSVNRTPTRGSPESVTRIKPIIQWSTRLQKHNSVISTTQLPTTTANEFETEITESDSYPTSESTASASTTSEIIPEVSENLETLSGNWTSTSYVYTENSPSSIDALDSSTTPLSNSPTTDSTMFNATPTSESISRSSTTMDSSFLYDIHSSGSTEAIMPFSASSSSSEQNSSGYETTEPETLSSTYSSTPFNENYEASSSSNDMTSSSVDYSSSSLEPTTKVFDSSVSNNELENTTVLPISNDYSYSTDTTEPSSTTPDFSSSGTSSNTFSTANTLPVLSSSSMYVSYNDSETTPPYSSSTDKNEISHDYKVEISSTTESITQMPVTVSELYTDDFGTDYFDEEDHQASNIKTTTQAPFTESASPSSISYSEYEPDSPTDNEEDKNKNESYVFSEVPDVKVSGDVTTEIITIAKTTSDIHKLNDNNNNTIDTETHDESKESQNVVTTSVRTTSIIGDKTTGTSTTDGPIPQLPLWTLDNVPEYLQLRIDTTWSEMCHSEDVLRKIIIRLFKNGTGRNLRVSQISFLNVSPEKCSQLLKSSASPITVDMVFLNESGKNISSSLNKDFVRLYKHKGLDSELRVRDVQLLMSNHRETLSDEMSNSTTIAAIFISCIAVVCLLLVGVLLIVLRKRQKGFNYGQRCTPVSLDDYSLDNISVYNSVRRKNAIRASKCSYGNPAFDDPITVSHPLNFGGLTSFCTNRKAVDEEFAKIPVISPKMDELPQGAETKNRYANVIPLPETRVHLSIPEGGEPLNEYINANYIKGVKGVDKFYIGCQAPMQSTVNDFWRMVWEQQCKIIMMLTDLHENGVEKCYDYLPPSEVLDCHRLFGDYQVTLKKREVREKYVISLLQLKNLESNLWREVTHLWYMNWPHQGVPDEGTSIIAFLIEARSYMRSTSGPHIVHCSPGTGRTGTVIAIDLCIREFETNRSVDIPKTVYALRRDRAGAVQTRDQYAYIYQVLNIYAAKLTGGAMDSI